MIHKKDFANYVCPLRLKFKGIEVIKNGILPDQYDNLPCVGKQCPHFTIVPTPMSIKKTSTGTLLVVYDLSYADCDIGAFESRTEIN